MPIDEVLLVNQLVFVGLNGYIAALDRDTGKIVWSNNQLRAGSVTLMLDGDRLIVSSDGFMYCLDPCSGRILWHNPMIGYGYGVTSLASVRGQSPGLAQAAEQSAAASTAAIAASS